jgi:hypothetical protein
MWPVMGWPDNNLITATGFGNRFVWFRGLRN